MAVPTLSGEQGPVSPVRVGVATFQRTWKVTRRAYPWTYLTSTVLSGALTIALAYLAFHAVGGRTVQAQFLAEAASSDYVGYVAVGAVAYAFTVRLLLWTSKALIGEEREGTLVALVAAPAGRLPYLLGFAAFAVLSTAVEALALCAVAGLLGVRLPQVDPVALGIAVAVFAVAVFAVSMLLGPVMLLAGEAHITQNTVFLGLALVCGFMFPRGYLPDAVEWVGDVLPITAALDAVRAALSGRALDGGIAPLAVSLAVSAAFILAGRLLLPRAERQAVERSL